MDQFSSFGRNRLAVDIGGTFTDSVVVTPRGTFSSKVLTTPRAPERGAIDGIRAVLERASLRPDEIDVFVHGTTIATNTVIERKGAETAFLTTQGFRDVLDIGYESRHDQYNLQIEKLRPLIPRHRRIGVPERIEASGNVKLPLDVEFLRELVPRLVEAGIESVAVGYLHSYMNPAHERRTRDVIMDLTDRFSITLSSEVCPEIREYERFTTAVVNAYVQPSMSRYLKRLVEQARQIGLRAPLYLMTSGGGLTNAETAIRFPVRLLESGPAGGALLACQVAKDCGVSDAVSFDMGGTTAKFALITDQKPLTTRVFEVDRQDRYIKGSGMPIRIPAIELVEIGAGGGSIARVDHLMRIAVGPESAAADPGPVCYDKGGTRPTVTDADVVQGRIIPERFAGGQIRLDIEGAASALYRDIGIPLGLGRMQAAFALSEIVDEMMANAGRKHAVERGKDLRNLTMIAFGGAAPLHACRLARKMGIDRVIVPRGAGVGSALGFLSAPISFEVVRTLPMELDAFDADAANRLLGGMADEARAIVEAGAGGAALREGRSVLMRYRGQGNEIVVSLPDRTLRSGDAQWIRREFERSYEILNAHTIQNGSVEILSWSVQVAAEHAPPEPVRPAPTASGTAAIGSRRGFDPQALAETDFAFYWRDDLQPGGGVSGPAIIAEDETSTFVDSGFDFRVLENGCLLLTLRDRTGDEE